MPSPLNLRARLRALFGRDAVPKTNSEEQDIQAFSDELTKAMHLLAGGREACQKIYKWLLDHPEIDEVFAHTTKRSELSFLIQETSFARVIRRYEKELGLESRVFGNKEIQNVLDHGRHIRAIQKEAGSDEIHFAYTMGNSTRDPIVPELICFFPSSKTCAFVLDQVSKHLTGNTVPSPLPGEIIEIDGVLGAHREIPVRIRLLNGDTLEYAKENWATGIPKTEKYPLLLVDIPDVEGFFPCENECEERIKNGYPLDLLSSEVTKVQYLEPDKSDLPLTANSASICLHYLRNILNQGASSESEEGMSDGTWVTLINMADWIDPDSWDDDDSEDQLIKDAWGLLTQCSYKKGARNWVLERLDPGNSTDEIAEEWSLPCNKPGEPDYEPIFSSQDDLIDQIQWNLVTVAAAKTLDTITDKDKLDQMLEWAKQYDERTAEE